VVYINSKVFNFLRSHLFVVVFLSCTVIFLIISSNIHFLLFHAFAELVAIMVSFSIFTLAWAARQYIRNGYLIILGAAYGAIGLVDIFHTLTYKGLNVLPGMISSTPSQFWIVARMLEALALVIAPLYVQRLPNFERATASFFIPAILGCLAVFLGVMPDTFVEGSGLTAFKIYIEFFIITLLIVGFILLWQRKKVFPHQVYLLLQASIVFAIASEVCFVHYITVYDFVSELGHYFRFFSVVLAYFAFVVTGVQRPAELLYRELEKAQAALLIKVKEADLANQAKSLFLATMSHEIRTPLNSVLGLIGLLAESPLEQRQREYTDKILSSARTLHALIDDILDISSIEAGALRLEHAPFSLNEVLRDTASFISVATYGKPIEAVFDVAPDVPDTLIGDAMRLQQVLMNLATNAVKFTDEGEIIFSVRRISEEDSKVALQFTVRDTGIGIAPERLDHIFDMFTQADPSIRGRYGGSGLGLAICAKLTELMGGLISVESQFAQGSKFSFIVRVGVERIEPSSQQSEKLSGLHVLIIEDHPLTRTMLSQSCANFGWQATTLSSGAEGLDELRRSTAEGNDYDILLVDWHMPVMNGYEMLQQAQAAPDIHLPKVILMATIVDLEHTSDKYKTVHFDGFLSKPTITSRLYDAVSRTMTPEINDFAYTSSESQLPLAGVCLLVTEDNEINRLVIEMLLTRAGAEVMMVADGLAAVEAVRKSGSRFDAVLMDIQMPVMDGYTATRVIREELGLLDLPIIALTAYAQPEDREKSRLAGMVGHLVKPFDVKTLFRMLAGVRRNTMPQPATVAKVASIELPGLDVTAGLETFGGDANKYGELLRKFIALHKDDVEEAQTLFSSGDSQGAARLIHDIRGVAAFLSAKDVAQMAMATEKAILTGNPTIPPFGELQVTMDVLAASIGQFDIVLNNSSPVVLH